MDRFFQIIIYLGAMQGLLLAVFLFSIKLNKISNRLLGLLTLLWGIFLMAFALQDEGLYRKMPHLLKVFYQFLFLFFPLLYLQVKYLLMDYTKFHWKDLFHFLPFFLSLIFYLDFYVETGEEKLNIIGDRTQYYIVLQIIGDEVIALQGIVYSIISLNMIQKYRQKIKDYESTVDKNIVRVLFLGISLNLFSWIIGIAGIHLEYLSIVTKVDLFAIAYVVLVLVIYTISFVAVRSPEVFKLDINQLRVVLPRDSSHDDLKNSTDDEVKLERSKTDQPADLNQSLHAINDKLLRYMEEEKPYLEPELSLPELARMLDIPRNQLSGVINQFHKKNFYEFVNQYRINEVKQLLTDPKNKNLKLISLAYDAGFNSKASFNRIFKQMTDLTPSQFLIAQQSS